MDQYTYQICVFRAHICREPVVEALTGFDEVTDPSVLDESSLLPMIRVQSARRRAAASATPAARTGGSRSRRASNRIVSPAAVLPSLLVIDGVHGEAAASGSADGVVDGSGGRGHSSGGSQQFSGMENKSLGAARVAGRPEGNRSSEPGGSAMAGLVGRVRRFDRAASGHLQTVARSSISFSDGLQSSYQRLKEGEQEVRLLQVQEKRLLKLGAEGGKALGCDHGQLGDHNQRRSAAHAAEAETAYAGGALSAQAGSAAAAAAGYVWTQGHLDLAAGATGDEDGVPTSSGSTSLSSSAARTKSLTWAGAVDDNTYLTFTAETKVIQGGVLTGGAGDGGGSGARTSAQGLIRPPAVVIPGFEMAAGPAPSDEPLKQQGPNCNAQQQRDKREQRDGPPGRSRFSSSSSTPDVLSRSASRAFPGGSSGSGGLGLREAAALAAAASIAIGTGSFGEASKLAVLAERGNYSEIVNMGDSGPLRSKLVRVVSKQPLARAPSWSEEGMQGALPLEAIAGLRLSNARLNYYLLAVMNQQVRGEG